jgi:hypothetical protein
LGRRNTTLPAVKTKLGVFSSLFLTSLKDELKKQKQKQKLQTSILKLGMWNCQLIYILNLVDQ